MADDDKKGKPDKGAAADKGAAPQKSKGAPQGKGAKGERGARGKGEKSEKQAAPTPRPKDYKPRMKSHYEKVVRDELAKEFGYGNAMQIPRIEKIVLNMGVGEAVNDRKKVDAAAKDLAMIAGQRPV